MGGRLAQARQARGWSVAQAAAALKVPAHVVSSLESGQWQRLGAPVFVRGQLRSYARQLGLDPDSVVGQASVEQWVPVTLVSHVRTNPLRRWTEGALRQLLTVAAVVAVLVVGVMVLRQQLASETPVLSLDEFPALPADGAATGPVELPPEEEEVPGTGAPAAVAAPAALPATPAGAVADAQAPAAGAAGNPPAAPAPAPAAAGHGLLELQFGGQSWVEIRGRDGRMIERAMIGAGQSRRYPVAEVDRVLLGNATQVTARLQGRELDLAPLRRSNVARFTVSSDGSASPVAN